MTAISPLHRHATRQRGPNLAVLAAISLALTAAGVLVPLALAGGSGYVSPFAPVADVTAYFHGNPGAVRVGAVLQFGAAVPLGIYAATLYARQLRLGVRVPGPAIGFFGGACAAVFLMSSALVNWVLSRPEVTSDPTLTHALSFLAFAAGGVAYVVGSGLPIAGVAVPGLILRLLPAWLAWTGLILAAVSEVSFLSLGLEPFQALLPLGRYGGLLWLLAVGILLPVRRAAANAPDRP